MYVPALIHGCVSHHDQYSGRATFCLGQPFNFPIQFLGSENRTQIFVRIKVLSIGFFVCDLICGSYGHHV